MKKEVTVKVPAKKASTRKEERIYCDICSKVVVRSGYRDGGGRCVCCERDICRTHISYDPHEWGDYPSTYCTICYNIKYIKYGDRQEELNEKHDIEQDKLDEDVKNESLKELI